MSGSEQARLRAARRHLRLRKRLRRRDGHFPSGEQSRGAGKLLVRQRAGQAGNGCAPESFNMVWPTRLLTRPVRKCSSDDRLAARGRFRRRTAFLRGNGRMCSRTDGRFPSASATDAMRDICNTGGPDSRIR